MSVKTFKEIIDEHSSPRIYFSSKVPQRGDIKAGFDTHYGSIINRIQDNQFMGSHFLGVQISTIDFIYLYRLSRRGYQFLHHYDTSHLRNSVITNIIFNQDLSTKDRSLMITWIWYYYWFMKSEGAINNLTHNVCYELEEMIKLILQKEYTIYRQANTSEAVNLLRARLRAEGLVNLATSPRGINFRR